MAAILSPSEYVHLLRCPCSSRGPLEVGENQVQCAQCCREFPIGQEGILQLVDPGRLDAETARELQGNTYDLSDTGSLALAIAAERQNIWTSYYSRMRMKSTQRLARALQQVDHAQIFFLGAGTAREVEYLTHFMDLDTVYCSDLSSTALQLVPFRLAPYDLQVGLFTSDLSDCPVRSKDRPIVIVRALHHTQDMHAALDKLLGSGYEHIMLIEPTDNGLMKLLAKMGLARRVEYSGLKPGRLDLRRLRELCRQHGYRSSVTTSWAFPQDYFRRLFGRSRFFQAALFLLLGVASALTNPIHLGNTSVVILEKASRST